MSRVSEFWSRLRFLLHRGAMEDGLDDEIRFHIEQQTQRNVRRGMRPAEARRAAVLSFGGVDRVKEEVRDEVGPAWLENLWRDVRVGARGLLRTPVFTTLAVFTLALGIGANTAIFSVINAVLLKPLPLHQPERLLAIGEGALDGPPTRLSSTSAASFFAWKEGARSLQLAGYATADAILTGSGDAERLTGLSTIGGLFEVLAVPAAMGRTILEADEDPESEAVVVLSDGLWRRLSGEDPGIVGRTLSLSGSPHTVIGVMPQSFRFPDASAEFWVPRRFSPGARANRDQYFIQVVGRLAPTATPEQARAELDAVATTLREEWPTYNTGLRINLRPLHETAVAGSRNMILLLMGAVTLVLLITCANLGSMLLARASTRRGEMAVREALGARTGRIVQQFLVESLIISVGGAAAGLVVAGLFLRLLAASQSALRLPRADEIGLDTSVLLFAIAVSLSAGLFFGGLPAWHFTRRRSGAALRDGSRGSSAGSGIRGALVVAEIALAIILLVGAGLLLRSFTLLHGVDPGFPTARLLTFDVSRADSDPAFFQESIRSLEGIPTVRSAAIVSQLPMTGRGIGAWFNRLDRPLPPNVTPDGEAYRVVSPEYFATIGLPLRSGRLLSDRDGADNPAVVINEALARKYYPEEDPVGREIYLGAPDNRLFDRAPIVGIVGDTRDLGLGSDALPTVYIPHAVMPYWRWFSYVLRTEGAPAAVAAQARAIMRDLDPSVPVLDIRTVEGVLEESVAPARWSTVLVGVFATIALLTSVLGVVGVLSFLVAQRTRELGIRMALGAPTGSVRLLVAVQGIRMILIGGILGLAGSVMLGRLLTGLLYGVSPLDPVTYLGVATLIAVTGALAIYIPARRATRVDPMIALRA